MTLKYLVFDTEADAVTRSRNDWNTHLGRDKRPEDVTEFMWLCRVGLDGKCALEVDDTSNLLTQTDQSQLIDTLPTDNWPVADI